MRQCVVEDDAAASLRLDLKYYVVCVDIRDVMLLMLGEKTSRSTLETVI